MVTKTITILEDAYQLLLANKLKQESFSEEIIRTFSRRNPKKLSDFFGILSEKEGDAILAALEKKRAWERANKQKRMRELYG